MSHIQISRRPLIKFIEIDLKQIMYRVAQNKIPHQTICNIFATSGQILKILEAV